MAVAELVSLDGCIVGVKGKAVFTQLMPFLSGGTVNTPVFFVNKS